MSSTHVSITNNSTSIVYAKLAWGFSIISKTKIDIGEVGQLAAEYVWYDLEVFKDPEYHYKVCYQNGVYGNSSWNLAGSPEDGFSLLQI